MTECRHTNMIPGGGKKHELRMEL